MNGFRTARALVVDDKPEEALPVIRALASLGIALTYHDASPEADYSKKHLGMHLLVLDMVLANRGTPENDEKQVLSTLIGALEDLLGRLAGVVVIVCWTKHPSYQDSFLPAFQSAFPETRVAEVIFSEKADLSDPEKVKKLAADIQGALQKLEPAELLLNWEQIVHDAATSTTAAIYDLASRSSKEKAELWTPNVYALCAALALAERGKRLATESELQAVSALSDALTPLLGDRIEYGEAAASDTFKKNISATLLQTVKEEVHQWTSTKDENGKTISEAKSLLSSEDRARLQAMVTISAKVKAGDICPGNVYRISYDQKENRLIVEEVFKEFQLLLDDVFFEHDGKPPKGAFAIMVEITSICDFAQAKRKLPRFICGFLVPVGSDAATRQGAGHIRKIGPIALEPGPDTEGGMYSLFLNSHYLIGIKQERAEKLSPMFRLRTGVLSDLIFWQGTHGARPGYIQLGP